MTKVFFAVTYTSESHKLASWLALTVFMDKPGNQDYRDFSIGENSESKKVKVHVSTVVDRDLDAFMSIQATVSAALRGSEYAATVRDIYIDVDYAVKDSVKGSSLGLAIYVAMMAMQMGKCVPERYVFTGMVTVGVDNCLTSTLMPIDSFPVKATAAVAAGKCIFAPEVNVASTPFTLKKCNVLTFDPNVPCVVSLRSVEDVHTLLERYCVYSVRCDKQ